MKTHFQPESTLCTSLSACPECFAPAALHPVSPRVGQTFYVVTCQACGAGPSKAFASETTAVQYWNTRSARATTKPKSVVRRYPSTNTKPASHSPVQLIREPA